VNDNQQKSTHDVFVADAAAAILWRADVDVDWEQRHEEGAVKESQVTARKASSRVTCLARLRSSPSIHRSLGGNDGGV
jgi:hypothetical protein